MTMTNPACDLVLCDMQLPDGRTADVSIRDGRVVHVGAKLPSDDTFSCRGYTVLPGAVDMHVHMRGGPQRGKEDWRTGSMSAIAGGVTVVVDQPNTIPPLTNPESYRARVAEAREGSLCSFAINAGVTAGTDLAALWREGAMAFGELFSAPSSYAEGLAPGVLAAALTGIGELGGLATIHAESVAPGQPRDLASHSRLRGPAGEAQAVRDLADGGHACRLHFCHLSTASAIAAAGPATVEVTPHHLFLSHEQADATDARFKVNPPLRTETERERLWTAWDRIDVIASDHAPHTRAEKAVPFGEAPSGIPGVETMLPLLVAAYRHGMIDLHSLVYKTSWRPADILGIPRAGFNPGERADFALYGANHSIVSADTLHSRAGWTPYEGVPAVFPTVVVLGGDIVYRDGEYFPGSPAWYPGRGYIP